MTRACHFKACLDPARQLIDVPWFNRANGMVSSFAMLKSNIILKQLEKLDSWKGLRLWNLFLFQGSFATWKNASSGHRVGVYCGGSWAETQNGQSATLRWAAEKECANFGRYSPSLPSFKESFCRQSTFDPAILTEWVNPQRQKTANVWLFLGRSEHPNSANG